MRKTMRMMMLAVMLMAGMSVDAQDVRIVIVQHGDDLQVFNGGNGFKNAVAAAQPGDVLLLSQGEFSDVTIDKPLSIQGAGYLDNITKISNVYINLPDSEDSLIIEGLRLEKLRIKNACKNMIVRRCRIGRTPSEYRWDWAPDDNYYGYGINFQNQTISNCQIEQCRISFIWNVSQCESLGIYNSCIYQFHDSPSTSGTLWADHCIISYLQDKIVCQNSIIYQCHRVTEGVPLYNCIYQEEGSQVKIDCLQKNINSIIEGGFSAYWAWASNDLAPKAEIAEESKAYTTDGTVMGVFGGTLGFTNNPLNPQIESSEIAREVDENGKLNVKITVKAATE